jgi:hypothetical protein
MDKQVIDRGYLTYALTDGDKEIFGTIKDCHINDWSHKAKVFYWSEVFVDGNIYQIHRRGTLLINKTNEQLSELHEQSKVNLGARMAYAQARIKELQEIRDKFQKQFEEERVNGPSYIITDPYDKANYFMDVLYRDAWRTWFNKNGMPKQ